MSGVLPQIHGSIVALVTPMLEDGKLDWSSLDALVDWHIAQGTHGLVAVGTTGESATLDVAEHAQVIERVLQRAAGRVPVIAGTGANSTKEAIELTRTAKQLGATAALLVTPYYNKPTQEGLYQHYKAIAEAVDLPQMLYNVPSRTGVDMANETVFRLADIDNIFSIKDATGDLTRGKALIDGLNGKIDVFSGDDATAWQLMLMGALGNVSVTANVAPNIMANIANAALSGNAELAEQLNSQVQPLHDVLFIESNPIPAKWALHEMNKITSGIRLPLTVLAMQYRAAIHKALKDTHILS